MIRISRGSDPIFWIQVRNVKRWRIFRLSSFLCAFAKIAKADCWLRHVSSALPQGATRLPLDGFSWSFIFENFSKICPENWNFVKIWQAKRVFALRRMNIYDRNSLNFSYNDKFFKTICRVNQKIHFIFSIFFFPKSFRLCHNVVKYTRVGQATDDNMAHAHYMQYT